MSEDKVTKLDLAKLEGRLNTQEEKMKAQQANYQASWETIRANMQEMKADMARRDTRMLIALIAVVGLATTILGTVLGLMIHLA